MLGLKESYYPPVIKSFCTLLCNDNGMNKCNSCATHVQPEAHLLVHRQKHLYGHFYIDLEVHL